MQQTEVARRTKNEQGANQQYDLSVSKEASRLLDEYLPKLNEYVCEGRSKPEDMEIVLVGMNSMSLTPSPRSALIEESSIVVPGDYAIPHRHLSFRQAVYNEVWKGVVTYCQEKNIDTRAKDCYHLARFVGRELVVDR